MFFSGYEPPSRPETGLEPPPCPNLTSVLNLKCMPSREPCPRVPTSHRPHSPFKDEFPELHMSPVLRSPKAMAMLSPVASPRHTPRGTPRGTPRRRRSRTPSIGRHVKSTPPPGTPSMSSSPATTSIPSATPGRTSTITPTMTPGEVDFIAGTCPTSQVH